MNKGICGGYTAAITFDHRSTTVSNYKWRRCCDLFDAQYQWCANLHQIRIRIRIQGFLGWFGSGFRPKWSNRWAQKHKSGFGFEEKNDGFEPRFEIESRFESGFGFEPVGIGFKAKGVDLDSDLRCLVSHITALYYCVAGYLGRTVVHTVLGKRILSCLPYNLVIIISCEKNNKTKQKTNT